MAKLATAQIEIKPVLNEQVLADVCRRIEDAIAGAIRRGYATQPATEPWRYPTVTWGSGQTTTAPGTFTVTNASTGDPAKIAADIKRRLDEGGAGVLA